MKVQVADFHSPHDVILQSLVPHVDPVVGTELALAVEVHVDVEAIGDHTARPQRELLVESGRRKTTLATRGWIRDVRGRAVQVAQPVEACFQVSVELDVEVGVPSQVAQVRPRKGGE